MPPLHPARIFMPMSASILLAGCATQQYVDSQIRALETRQNSRIDSIDKTAQEALSRATEAGKLAEGKFVYQMVMSDDAVKFPSGGVALSGEAEKRLAELAAKLIADNKNVYLEIQGHTDDVGGPAANLRLGQRRADAAMMFLHAKGVPLNRMTTVSYGESQPVATNDSAEGRAKNRRIVVVVLR